MKEKQPDWDPALRASEAIGPAGGAAAPVLAPLLEEDPGWGEVAIAASRLARPDLAAAAVPALIKAVESGVGARELLRAPCRPGGAGP